MLEFGRDLWDLENPLMEKTINNKTYKITKEVVQKNSGRPYGLFENKNLLGRYSSVEEAVKYVDMMTFNNKSRKNEKAVKR